MGRAALEIVKEKAAKKPISYTFYTAQADSVAFQLQLAEAAMLIDTAHLHAYRAADDIDEAAARGVYPDFVTRARVRADTGYNGPGRYERSGQRAPGVLRTEQVMPRKLGHAVLGSTDYQATQAFFVSGLGFKVSDYIKGAGAFLRCSIDHHNILVLAAPVSFLHHTSWQVDDIDDVGRGAYAMLEDHPERHVWGLGRHYGGSNFFWYLKDPAGNFSEYYSDMDCIIDDQLWTPEDLEGARGLYAWGPPPPPSFLDPEDLAALLPGPRGSRRPPSWTPRISPP